jgi:hypothetical protein
MPASISAIGIPWNAFGRLENSNLSRSPAIIIKANPKPIPIEAA